MEATSVQGTMLPRALQSGSQSAMLPMHGEELMAEADTTSIWKLFL